MSDSSWPHVRRKDAASLVGVCQSAYQNRSNKYSENAKSCKALVSMYINEFRGGGV